jgi:hypothetical protein
MVVSGEITTYFNSSVIFLIIFEFDTEKFYCVLIFFDYIFPNIKFHPLHQFYQLPPH